MEDAEDKNVSGGGGGEAPPAPEGAGADKSRSRSGSPGRSSRRSSRREEGTSSRSDRDSDRSRRHRRSRSRSGGRRSSRRSGSRSRSREKRSRRSRSRSRSAGRSERPATMTEVPTRASAEDAAPPSAAAAAAAAAALAAKMGATAAASGVGGAGAAAQQQTAAVALLLQQQQLAQQQALQLQMNTMGAGGAAGAVPAALGGFPGVMNQMSSVQQQQVLADKTLRELFVGNTPPNTSEFVLMEFLNAAMRQVKLTTSPGNPIINCRVNNKFAFIELRSVQETNKALSLTGIPFMGEILKVGRPSKYQGPLVQTTTWQALTGQQIDPTLVDPNTKVLREVYIGNINDTIGADVLKEFLSSTMMQVGFTKKFENGAQDPSGPIISCRCSGNFAFAECRSVEEATNILSLNNIPFMGQHLRVNRPSKYPGPPTPHMNWEDVVAKFMAGELSVDPATGLVSTGGGATAVPAAAGAAGFGGTPAPGQALTRVLRLNNMVTGNDLADEASLGDIEEETKEECMNFGAVKTVHIPRPSTSSEAEKPGVGFVFVEFEDLAGAGKGFLNLSGRTFDGRKVEAVYWQEDKWQARDFTLTNQATAA